ncbi:hypothetical protein MTBBW1_1680063 [Desulfamplus magnetovallimortis]|uniref:Uncharacterized protein n=1 Tax=Desulfamplus magnetovallimortis TaxID=1246637 RepID=A0A1W1H9K3_9BACT|nr:hypothetical protein MTBBW1_1680063 [Desulfamplus magnetovallimortis]
MTLPKKGWTRVLQSWKIMFYTKLQSNKGGLYENNKPYFVPNVQDNQTSA